MVSTDLPTRGRGLWKAGRRAAPSGREWMVAAIGIGLRLTSQTWPVVLRVAVGQAAGM